MQIVTVFSLVFLSAAFVSASASNNPPDPDAGIASHLQLLTAAVTPAIVIAAPQGPRFYVGPIHVTGWRHLLEGEEEGGADSATESAALPDLDPEEPESKRFAPLPAEVICRALERAAEAHDLPLLFFARLIWQESRFKTDAVSRAGAQGVAQFMPAVAAEMGLEDPFDPIQALPVSARLLSRLYERFGNWGLAAAAYNGGPRRVSEWLSRKGKLPKETRHYVRTITGLPAEAWAGAAPLEIAFERPPRLPCDNLPRVETHVAQARIPMPPGRPEQIEITEASAVAVSGSSRQAAEAKPWAVQLAAHWSPKQALAGFERLRKEHPQILGGLQPSVIARGPAGRSAARQRVQVAMQTRSGAEQLCARLKAAGGACLVRKN
jgi:hypothetical protein